jgi:hypothetical protein
MELLAKHSEWFQVRLLNPDSMQSVGVFYCLAKCYERM